MHRRIFSVLVLGFMLTSPVLRAAESAAPVSAGKEAKPASPWDGIKQGDSADKIVKSLGAPDETRPMKAPSGKAEVWVYVKEVSRRMDRIDRSTQDVVVNVTEADGSVRRSITPGQVRFEDVHYVTEDVAEVLMFNDRYVVHKVTRMERKL